jgi:hypothetical protein
VGVIYLRQSSDPAIFEARPFLRTFIFKLQTKLAWNSTRQSRSGRAPRYTLKTVRAPAWNRQRTSATACLVRSRLLLATAAAVCARPNIDQTRCIAPRMTMTDGSTFAAARLYKTRQHSILLSSALELSLSYSHLPANMRAYERTRAPICLSCTRRQIMPAPYSSRFMLSIVRECAQGG